MEDLNPAVPPVGSYPGIQITGISIRDVRFPTSLFADGSDAMHVDPDYSCAYVVLTTNHENRVEGHGLTFTLGKGTNGEATLLNVDFCKMCGIRDFDF